MFDAYISEIRLFGQEQLPPHWLPCDGRLLNIRDAQALYACIGNMYGGDGTTTFALPDLRGRVPLGVNWQIRIGEQLALVSERNEESLGTRAVTFAIATQGMFPSER
ncbi:MAG TPA: phage tail protein [Thermoanaerobaculia bacterium]